MPNQRDRPLSRFSHRAHPHLYEINTWVWLEELSARHGRVVSLKDVPDEEWERLGDLGFDFVYLMGVWKRSLTGSRIFRTDARNFAGFDAALPGWKTADVVGSPFSIQEYRPDPRVGTEDDLDAIHRKLRAKGMGLILDFVPNHTGFDYAGILDHPNRYILGSEEDFRRDPAAFYLAEREDGQNFFIARGKDPYFAPWSDVAQLNYFSPDCRKAMIGVLKNIARYCDGVRCDMAMLVTNEVFIRTWLRFLESWPVPKTEFWQEAIAELPGFVWLAEVYWDMEWTMQQLGFHYTYDKRLYDRLREGSSRDVRAHLVADVGYQSKMARFLENHDEPRCAATFPRERLASVATLLSTLPGLRFYHHGQFDGAKTFVPMPLARAKDEAPDGEIRTMYKGLLGFADAEIFHAGDWRLLEVRAESDDTFEDLIAYRWDHAGESRLVVVNLGNRTAQGRVQQAESGSSQNCLYHDLLDGKEYLRERAGLSQNGLYVRLAPYQAHVFTVAGA